MTLSGAIVEPTWPKNLNPFRYQIEGAKFVLSHRNSYLCDEPGLGKTIQAIMVMNTLKPQLTVIICPPFLCLNWEKELKAWSTTFRKIQILRKMADVVSRDSDVIIVPDSIIYYAGITEQFYHRQINFMIIDEAHRFKSHDAKRTLGLEAIAKNSSRICALSGTPMPNRPIELFTMIKMLDHNAIDLLGRHSYGLRYCGAHHNGFGWDYSGAARLPELSSKLKDSFMIRRRKADVLTELPEKVIQILEIEPNFTEKNLIKREQKEFKKSLKDLSGIAQFLSTAEGESTLARLSSERKDIAFSKAQRLVPIVEDILENPKQKLIVFGYHNEPLKELARRLEEFKPMLIQGDTPKDKRDLIVTFFQNDPDRRLLIGNYLACGVGLTLTAADRVLFLEPSWVPAENEQAIDRTHRIGQKNSVLAQFVVFKGSLDELILKSNFKKLDNIHKTLNQ
jgi:SWI/SNF-related matrix-associated actin-dependent regulator of chromatin subfamily A-like protein 1